jgi:hypothetical protein
MKFAIALAALVLGAGAAQAAQHACAADALARAPKLLKTFWENDDLKLADQPGPPTDDGSLMAWDLDSEVATLPPVKNPAGTGKYDVLEVGAFIYKASYRLRFLYAQGMGGDCVLMGEEILDLSDPY